MRDANLFGLLAAIAGGDLEAVPVLGDLLEEQDDPRAGPLRDVYIELYEDRLFAPFCFQHFNLPRRKVLPLFPEYDAPDESGDGGPA
jgi:hypothetical protein